MKIKPWLLSGGVILWLSLIWPPSLVSADSGQEEPTPLRTEQLTEIQAALLGAENELKTLKKSAAKATEQQDPALFADLKQKNEEVEKLQQSLEKTATGGLELQAIDVTEPPFDWREEMAGITRPIIESLKKLTSKPRQTARLNGIIDQIDAQQKVLEKGLSRIEQEIGGVKDSKLQASLQALQKKWQQQAASLEREKAIIATQLQALEEGTSDWRTSFGQSMEGFFAGRALTLLLAIVMAVGVWLMFRILNRHLWRYHASRRGSPLYRFFMYSFHAFSTIFIVLVVFIVFYLRDDVLLLGLGVLVLVASLISLQRALPRFLKEVNLLLNLGSAREGERLIYNGVPYRVRALNVFTILSNPALSGVHRLPLEQLATLFSRPVLAEEPWFPSDVGDALLLPDSTLVIVQQQSVEQVIVKDLGGSLRYYSTTDFFALDLINLTRSGTFTVSTVFGLDYRHQHNILNDYPALIREEIPQALTTAGFDITLNQNLGVEFKTANASSLDLVVWASFDSQLAASYKKLERVLQQACLQVCNQHNLTIPFPQLSIHVENLPLTEPA